MSIAQHCHWRTVEEYRHENVPLSTPSNEASKMYDATLTQLFSFHDDPALGGVPTTLQKMLEADPNFVVGQAMSLDLELFGGATPRLNPELKASVDKLVAQAEADPGLAPAERRHVNATQLYADGYLKEACEVWEKVLLDHPRDMLALQCVQLGYVYLGDSNQLRDSFARVLPHWKPSTPLYGYLLGHHAFGLEETNMFERAEKVASKALEINQHDAWATHALSHVFEMTGQQDRGVTHLLSTVKDWEVCEMLACHNWWHLALHYIEKGNYKEALEIFESQVKKLTVSRRQMFNVTDAASLLFRLEMEGVKVDAEHWRAVQEVGLPHLDEHTMVFNDLHLLMSCLGSGDNKSTQRMLESLEDFVRTGCAHGTSRTVHSQVGLRLCQAMAAYKEGECARAVELVLPVRYQIITCGGSHAQRDVFNLFLIACALQSSKPEHHRLARTLLAERKSFKENSPMTDRLMARAMALHSD